jgi:phosphomannomutase
VFDGNLDLEGGADGVMVRDAVRDGDGVLLALFVLELVWVAL